MSNKLIDAKAENAIQRVIDSYFDLARENEAHVAIIGALIPVVCRTAHTNEQIAALVAAQHALKTDARDYRQQAIALGGKPE
jgi:hypothetical protein